MDSNLIITTPAELRALIADEVSKVIVDIIPAEPPHTTCNNMILDEAVQFLKENGIAATRSAVYNRIHKNAIPHHKFGRRLLFYRSELEEWIRSNTQTPAREDNVAARIAASAKRKN